MNEEHRGPWYLLTGLVLGIILGVAYTWLIQPVQYVDTAPASLRADFKDRYRAMIAVAYTANGDPVRARARLELLGDSDIYRALAEQAQRTLAEQGSSEEARALGLLAIALGQASPVPGITDTQTALPTASPTHTATSSPTPTVTSTATASPSPTPPPSATPIAETPASSTPATPLSLALQTTVTPSATLPPRPTSTPPATRTSTPTPGAPFIFLSRDKVCDMELSRPLFQVEALNLQGKPVAGVLVIVTWSGGEERFFTGLKPEIGPGYADFVATPGVIYALRLGEAGEPVTNLTAADCVSTTGKHYWGAWQLKFIQP